MQQRTGNRLIRRANGAEGSAIRQPPDS